MHSAFLRALVILIGGAVIAAPARAARLLQWEIEQDGTVIMTTYMTDDGAIPRVVWNYLGDPQREPFDSVSQFAFFQQALIEPSEDDPLRTSLSGNLVLRVKHADRVLAQASLRRLDLVRKDAASSSWRLAPGEVERTAAAAGLAPPPATLTEQIDERAMTAILVLGGLCVLGAAGVFTLIARSRRKIRRFA